MGPSLNIPQHELSNYPDRKNKWVFFFSFVRTPKWQRQLNLYKLRCKTRRDSWVYHKIFALWVSQRSFLVSYNIIIKWLYTSACRCYNYCLFVLKGAQFIYKFIIFRVSPVSSLAPSVSLLLVELSLLPPSGWSGVRGVNSLLFAVFCFFVLACVLA